MYMKRRTTIEIDDQLLKRAQQALGRGSIRETVEEALRRAADREEQERADRAARQLAFLEKLSSYIDVDVLKSEEMWR